MKGSSTFHSLFLEKEAIISMIQAVFLDRDGTIGGSDTVELPGSFEMYKNAEIAISMLKDRNIPIFSFTNQPDISRGKCTAEEFEQELKGFGFNDIYLCPHTHEDRCSCRKPGIDMLLRARDVHELDLAKCVVIGDRWSDMVAAGKAGAMMIPVKTGAGVQTMEKHRSKWDQYDPLYEAKDILDGVNWLIFNNYLKG